MQKGEIAAIVTVAGLFLADLGITGVDSTMLTSAVNGLVSFVVIGAALVSWYQHRNK